MCIYLKVRSFIVLYKRFRNDYKADEMSDECQKLEGRGRTDKARWGFPITASLLIGSMLSSDEIAPLLLSGNPRDSKTAAEVLEEHVI
jgi:hypothetical protein